MKKNNINADIHVITGSVEISPGIGLADGIFDIVSSGSTLVSNNLAEVEVVMKSEALLIGNWNMDEEKHEILNEMLFRFEAVRSAQDKKYVMMNALRQRFRRLQKYCQASRVLRLSHWLMRNGALSTPCWMRSVSGKS